MLTLENMPLSAIEMVKRHLHITWSDIDTDEGLVRKMVSAELAINHKLGAACDILSPGQAQELYLNYMLYSWNDALNEFDSAYRAEILQVRHIHAVRGEEYDPMNFRSRFSTYTDGVLFVCVGVSEPSDFSAVTNPTKTTDVRRIQKLDYTEVSRRESDQEFAESVGKSLDMKVKTPYHGSATTDRQVLIGSTLYDIFQMDWDADRKNMYLYLEKVRTLV